MYIYIYIHIYTVLELKINTSHFRFFLVHHRSMSAPRDIKMYMYFLLISKSDMRFINHTSVVVKGQLGVGLLNDDFL